MVDAHGALWTVTWHKDQQMIFVLLLYGGPVMKADASSQGNGWLSVRREPLPPYLSSSLSGMDIVVEVDANVDFAVVDDDVVASATATYPSQSAAYLWLQYACQRILP